MSRERLNKYSVFLLVLFIGYFCSITLFPHTHIINGIKITHSHPFNGDPNDPDHTHTESEANAINHINSFIALILTLCGIKTLLFYKGKRFNFRYFHAVISIGVDNIFRLRGPPAFV